MYNRAHVKTSNVIAVSTIWGWVFPLIFVSVCLAVDRSIYTQQHTQELFDEEGYKAYVE